MKVTKEQRELNAYNAARRKNKKFRESEWYGIRGMLSYWWAFFLILLGARESGKSYSVTEFFVRQWKKKGIPFWWLRLSEPSKEKLLCNNAEKLIDPDIRRKYDLDLKVRGDSVYDHGRKMATVLALSTFANDKGVALFDKDFLKNNPQAWYHICLDEFQLENGQRKQGDICYQFVNQLENIVRSTKERLRIFLIGNTLQECSDILTMFNFIPEEFGRYKLKSKKAVIDYMPPSDAYKARRKGSVADILSGDQSNFTNEIKFDKALVSKKRLQRPTMIIKFDKEVAFTVWDDRIVAEYHGEGCKNVVAMRPYIDCVFNAQRRDAIIQLFDQRFFLYHTLIANKRFQMELALIKPRKG